MGYVLDIFAAFLSAGTLGRDQIPWHQLGPEHRDAVRAHLLERYEERTPRCRPRANPSHGTPEVREWLEQHPREQFHYTPTGASWLNQVEGWFGILAKQSLFVTNFKSQRALREHLRAYLRAWNRNPTPFEWIKPARAHHPLSSPHA